MQDEAVRQGLKEYSNWPTFPQLYVKGELVGGCDIVAEMSASGELEALMTDKLGPDYKCVVASERSAFLRVPARAGVGVGASVCVCVCVDGAWGCKARRGRARAASVLACACRACVRACAGMRMAALVPSQCA